MTDDIVASAHAFLRGHTRADIRFDEHVRPIKYVIAPDGRLVAPVMVAMQQSVDTVLFVPELRDDAMEVQVTLVPFEEAGPGGGLADRWRIHHGDPPDVRWAHMEIDAARFEGNVLDGPALVRANPLAADEPALCRAMNADRDELRRMTTRFGRRNVEHPVIVAIDSHGFDVRGQLEVFRVPAPEVMPDAEAARRVLEEMREAARAGEETGSPG